MKYSRQVLFKHFLHISFYFFILTLFQLMGGGLDYKFWRALSSFILYPLKAKSIKLTDEFYSLNYNYLNKSSSHLIKRSLNEEFYRLYREVREIDTESVFYKYGIFFTCILFLMRCLNLIALPIMLFQFCGLVFYPAFPDPPKITSSNQIMQNTINNVDNKSRKIPFLCFRVVTRGSFPNLVKKNVERNHATCNSIKFDNYVIQVVTDKSIGFPDQSNFMLDNKEGDTTASISANGFTTSTYNSFTPGGSGKTLKKNNLFLLRQSAFELVVPVSYVTRRGSLYKARALQYALEDQNHFLSDDDWIVHLDEETLLTRDSLIGILNFTTEGRCDFGQGLITYAKDGVVNWLTTLADTFRVADDMGKNRFQLRFLGKPVFNWKGSYVVTRAAAERKVTFDVGLHGSVAEDCYFAMAAIKLQQKLAPAARAPRPPCCALAMTKYSTCSNAVWQNDQNAICTDNKSSNRVNMDNAESHHTAMQLVHLTDKTCDFAGVEGCSSSYKHHTDSNIDQNQQNFTTLNGHCGNTEQSNESSIGNHFNFRFDFVEGEMLEKSPFTVADFLKQRKRWVQGIYLIVHKCPELPIWSVKLCLVIFIYAWILMPVILINEIVISRIWPLESPRVLRVLTAFTSGTTVYMYAFGSIKSFFGGAHPLYPYSQSLPRALKRLSSWKQRSKRPRRRLSASQSTPSGAQTINLATRNFITKIPDSLPASCIIEIEQTPAVKSSKHLKGSYSFENIHDSTMKTINSEIKTSHSDSNNFQITNGPNNLNIDTGNNNVSGVNPDQKTANHSANSFTHSAASYNFAEASTSTTNKSNMQSGHPSLAIKWSIVTRLKKYFYRAIFIVACVIGSLAMLPFNVVIEVIAVVWGLVSSKHHFYIVSKQID